MIKVGGSMHGWMDGCQLLDVVVCVSSYDLIILSLGFFEIETPILNSQPGK